MDECKPLPDTVVVEASSKVPNFAAGLLVRSARVFRVTFGIVSAGYHAREEEEAASVSVGGAR